MSERTVAAGHTWMVAVVAHWEAYWPTMIVPLVETLPPPAVELDLEALA